MAWTWQTRTCVIAVGWLMGAVSTVAQEPPDSFVIKLERTACFGECPVYSVSIDSGGNVTYDGKEFVRVEGRQTGRIPAGRAAALFATAERIKFFDLRDQYRVVRNADGTETIVTDLPTAFVTITARGRSKRVEDYYGTPQGVKELEREIDEAAGTSQWIRIDAATLRQLVQAGRTPSPEEQVEWLRRALGQDEVEVVKALLEIGVDPNHGYSQTNSPPLMMAHSVEAVQLLLEAGADPLARNDNGMTPLWHAVYLSPEVTRVLLKAGVPADQPVDSDGRTALSTAAWVGNLGVVNALLAAGADPRRSVDGKSILDGAKDGRAAAAQQQPSNFGGKPHFVADHDGVVAALERALKQKK